MIIWRDDDVGNRSDHAKFLAVDDLFQRYGFVHTAAVVASGLDRFPELGVILRERNIDAQLHCWTHLDLTQSQVARDELMLGVMAIERHTGKRPTVLYPPWNRTSPEVEKVASALGLTVSVQKMSLDQYIRCADDDGIINFHYWHAGEVAQLEPAFDVHRRQRMAMKITDYAPRAAPFDTYLKGFHLVGVEVGVDAGAHAEAMLRYCSGIQHLYLVDRWPKDYHFGYCKGRLEALGYGSRFTMLQRPSILAAEQFQQYQLDFVYIDQEHKSEVVTADLQAWWPKVKYGGVLGYRNYTPNNKPVFEAVDAFVAANLDTVDPHVETGEIVLRRKAS